MARVYYSLLLVWLVGPTQQPTRSADALRKIPHVVSIAGRPVSARTYVWLNEGGSLIRGDAPDSGVNYRATITITTTDGAPLPSVVPESAWTLWRDSVWAAATSQFGGSDLSRSSDTLITRLWGGPQWMTRADSLDVVVRLRQEDGTVYLVRAPRQYLERVS
jgi:hypothetical protein